MDTSILIPNPSYQAGPFERYVQELCRQYVTAQLQEIKMRKKQKKTNRSFEYSFSLHFHLGIFIVP